MFTWLGFRAVTHLVLLANCPFKTYLWLHPHPASFEKRKPRVFALFTFHLPFKPRGILPAVHETPGTRHMEKQSMKLKGHSGLRSALCVSRQIQRRRRLAYPYPRWLFLFFSGVDKEF